ncbi:MAG: CRISPR-associated helicase Cas3' [Thiothrix sp.]
MDNIPMNYGVVIAHQREKDGAKQTLQQHLLGVANLAKTSAAKLGLAEAGELMGLLHDLGKYSKEFQDYINSALGNIDPDEDDYVDAKGKKGKVDHSTAGAQAIWAELAQQGQLHAITAQILALCIASHHSGLIDCLESNSQTPAWDRFSHRMGKPEDRAHLQEALAKMDVEIQQRFRQLIGSPALHEAVINKLTEIGKQNKGSGLTASFKQGLLVRLLFSCLIDADRVDTADFENPVAALKRLQGRYTRFGKLIDRLETKLASFTADTDVNKIRKRISDDCLQKASQKPGIFTLSVPTGGGKTLASLRFALNHVQTHGLERIIYVIPFTSIIDQNAEETRKILEPQGSGDEGSIVLEHHSNLTPEEQTWKTKILSENWDAPVVYTTMVQFLETLFGSGTRGARRMHQLSKAVLIFDEIQTLPINCVHLFNNAIHFLVDHCGSSVVLCTATQPLLHEVDAKKGRIELAPDSEMMPAVNDLFADLRRVEVIDKRKDVGGWSFDEVAEQAIKDVEDMGSCLVIVNTKNAAQEIFTRCKQLAEVPVFHLSTSMCPSHRKAKLDEVRALLAADAEVLCISTQLIEAGVDVDFGAVIRFTAGLDSIAQAAGRCNRNGKRPHKGRVSIVNPADENLSKLPSIEEGKKQTERVLRDFNKDPQQFDGGDLIGPTAMARYFRYYFFERQDEMAYPVSSIGWDDNLLQLLSTNKNLLDNYERVHKAKPGIYFRQAFMTAAKAFKAIDAPTRGIIVPYGERGKEIITALCAAYEPDKQFGLLREAQQYTVNVFPHVLQALDKAEAIHPVQDGIDILYLRPGYYSDDFGLTDSLLEGTRNYDVF